MPKNIKKKVKLATDVSYLNKDFDSFRAQLVNYASINYSEQMNDFTQAGLGGLLVDMAAYVGDSLSFYLDHQFNELNLETAIEEKNIERLVRLAGVKATPKAPATAYIDVSVVIPAKLVSGEYQPDPDLLPVVKAESIFSATNGTNFYLFDDIDFSIRTDDNFLDANVSINGVDSSGNPSSFLLTKEGVCTSGQLINETHVIGNTFVAFRTLALRKGDVSEIVFVKDSDNNEYMKLII